MNVVVVTVTYGNRFQFLKQVIDALVSDILVSQIVIVDNGSQNQAELEREKEKYSDKLHIIRLEKNLGSAVGFARGIEYARSQNATHMFLLDDDNVPEENALETFLNHYTKLGRWDVVLCGNRSNLVGNDVHFFERGGEKPTFTFFDLLSSHKMSYFRKLLFKKEAKVHSVQQGNLSSVNSFAYGGTLLPIEAAIRVSLPDESLVLYGDDIEYSWNVKKAGYSIYACKRPHIYDVDLTFGQDTHIVGLFDIKTKPFKVFYRIRNMVYLSRKHSRQGFFALYISMFFWFIGLFVLGLSKKGPNRIFVSRCILIVSAVFAGFFPRWPIPSRVSLP